jgi:cytochrome c551/c552
MIDCKPSASKITLLLLILIAVSFLNLSAQDGKALFQSKCAQCHGVFKDASGPALRGVTQREPWASKPNDIYDWVHNPGAYIPKSKEMQDYLARFKQMMTPFPALTKEEIDAIINYVETAPDPSVKPEGPAGETQTDNTQNAIIFGIISLILAIIALVLMYVNSNLKKLSDDAEGIHRPDPVPFYRNKVYIAMVAILFFVIGGYYLAKGAIGLGRQQNYQPEQPIFYSHKVHVGLNQINCLYCHGNAMESKVAAIPSVNVCMNCHKTITSYSGPELRNAAGEVVNGNAEIAKLHKYAGFDPNNPAIWDATKAKPVEWIKIHNLPDHVYFNHAQHVNAGQVQCQTCHGPIQEMDEVRQFSDLSMGWCVNCHRETKVNFFNATDTSGNKFYSIYEKFHNDIKSKRMDSVTVENIGGTECQKCHY